MTVKEFGNLLKTIEVAGKKLPFAAYGWSSAPSGDYGVYGQYQEGQFDTDNRFAESKIFASVDWFTRTDDETGKNAIESFFKQLQTTHVFAWYLNTVTFERETGFIHYEWNVEFT